MLTSFYTASVGAISQQKGLDVTANNIANASTGGFKADKASFSDLLYTNVREPESTDSNLKVGHGAKVGKTDTLFTPGSIQQTDKSLDYALTDNNTFFAVKTTDGSVKYTRNGSFQMSKATDGKFYLADDKGSLVLDSHGQTITVKDEDDKQNVGVYTFKNLDGLSKAGDSYFNATAVSGEASVAQNAKVKQKYVEGSSVDMADEMSNVITSQRAFEFNAKIVQISDELMQTLNSMR